MPSLYTPRFDKPFHLYTDTFANEFGKYLSQLDKNGKKRLIAYSTEKNVIHARPDDLPQREAYSVLEDWHRKLALAYFGSQIEVVLDHNFLSYLTEGMAHSSKIAQ